MLPLLPALILLLLKGPAGIERMAGNGLWPNQIRAGASAKSNATNEVVFASLLAIRGDKDMSRALIRLLTFVEPENIASKPHSDTEEVQLPVAIPAGLGRPQD